MGFFELSHFLDGLLRFLQMVLLLQFRLNIEQPHTGRRAENAYQTKAESAATASV